MHRMGIKARQQGKIAGDHQPLNVMGIGIFDGFADHRGKAGHAGFARPEKRGQRTLGLQKIPCLVSRHQKPVDAAHIFAPADDLTDKPFDGIERCAPYKVSALRRAAERQRIEKADIDIEGQERMVEEGIVLQHGVLRLAKARQEFGDEGVGSTLGIRPRHAP